MKKRSRRTFIKESAVLAGTQVLSNSPVALLIDAIARGSANRLLAEQTGTAPRKLVDFRYFASPPRWVFDLILCTNDAEAAARVNNKQVATCYSSIVNGRYTGTSYVHQKLPSVDSNIYFPYIWQFQVPKAGGGMRNMSELLSNFLTIRGINTKDAGHNGSEIKHHLAPGASRSLHGLVADGSSASIAAVYAGVPFYVFRSELAKSATMLNGSNMISSLLKPFVPASNTTKSQEQLVQNQLNTTRDLLASQMVDRNPNSLATSQAMNSARDLMFRSFGDLTVVWNTLKNKYVDLITRSFTMTIPKINDIPIGTTGVRDSTYLIESKVITPIADIRSLIDSSSQMDRLASACALAEFVLMNDISDSLCLRVGPTATLLNGKYTGPRNPDEHDVGAMVSTYINTMEAVAQAACMLELIDRIKAKGIWSDTIISVGSEFNRSPKNDGSGADHGFEAASMSLYSGAISGPIVLGNIEKNTSGNYSGTWGRGANQSEVGGQIDLADVANSLATVLRTPKPVPGKSSLLSSGATGIVPAIASGKLI